LAVLLFAVTDGPVYFSSEFKPYQSDVAAALGLLILGVFLTTRTVRLTSGSALAIGLMGLCLLAFSFAAVFVIAAVSATLVTWLAVRGRRTLSVAPALVALVWVAASLGILALAATNTRFIRESFGSGSFLGISGQSSLLPAVNVMGEPHRGGIGLPQD